MKVLTVSIISLSLSFLLMSAYFICRETISIENIYMIYHSAVIGGFLSSSLHALTGPDHMAALLPIICGRRWYISFSVGSLWGFGHGVTSAFIGFISYKMKSFILQSIDSWENYEYCLGIVVGFTLIVVGFMGILESGETFTSIFNLKEPVKQNTSDKIENENSGNTNDLESTLLFPLFNTTNSEDGINDQASIEKSNTSIRIGSLIAIFANGVLLGLSWDGLPSLTPAMVLEAKPLIVFLVSYLIGTLFTMGFAAAIVGEATCWMNRVSNSNISHRMAVMSSLAAVFIGIAWVLNSFFKYLNEEVFNNNNMNNDGFFVDAGETYRSSKSLVVIIEGLLSTVSIAVVVGVILLATQKEFGIGIAAKPGIYRV